METAERETVNVAPGITRTSTKSELVIDETKGLYVSEWQKKGTKSAQLRQGVTTISEYPSSRVSNDRQGNIFLEEEFGFASQEFIAEEKRVSWIDVPEAMTIAQVKARLTEFPDAVLYKVLDNKPVLTSDQNYAITAGLRTLDQFAATQVIRYPEDHPVMPGKIILDRNGKVQYRAVFFSPIKHEDEDNRKADLNYAYVPEEIKAEVLAQGSDATVVPSQGI